MIAGFFFDSQEDFGGDGSRPEFSGWDAFDWSDLLTKINNLGPPRNQGALAAKWQNLESVHLLKTVRKPESRFNAQDATAYEYGRVQYEHRVKG